MTKVANLLSRNSNIFDAMRLFAAILVIWSHSYAMIGRLEPIPYGMGVSLGSLGVHIFFILSGLLITASWVSHPRVGAYLGKRALRILPALTLVIVVSAFVIGSIFTTLGLVYYLKSNDTFLYLNGIFIFGIQYNLPGVFQHNPIVGTVNGSIWTLPYEVAAYFMIAIFGKTGFLKRKKTIILLFLMCVALTFVTNGTHSNHFLFTLNVNAYMYFTAYFLSGVVLYLYRDKIPLNWQIAVIAALVLIISIPVHAFYLTLFFTLPYLVMFIGSLTWTSLTALSKYGDFSYGMYIFAWPVQQSLVDLLHNKVGHTHLFVYTMVITLPLAIASWHFLEKPMLKLKTHFNVDRYPMDADAW
jgi:peptidoglycan/LPS O-acetylase OafA/YrhL